MLITTRYIIIGLWFLLGGLPVMLICLLRPFSVKNINQVLSPFTRVIVKILGLKIIIRGPQNFNHRPCIFISNHQNYFDSLVGFAFGPPMTVSLGKKSIKFIPFIGQLYWLSGNILIDRSNRNKALRTMDYVAQVIRDRKLSLWIMPEGTRSRGRGLLPFKKGAFHTALMAQVPLVPVCYSPMVAQFNFNRWHSGTIIYEALAPISVQGLDNSIDNVIRLRDQAHELMKKTIERLGQE
ncbi:MAG: 1-acylglycerol-3-phosphate O-acyltransferase, partial [Pseudomonadota bacterium]